MAKFFGLVFGSQSEQPKQLEVNVDTVYIRSNIERVVSDEEGKMDGWQYEETQYDLKEFQETVGKDTNVLKVDVTEIAEMATTSFVDIISVAETLNFVLEQNMILTAQVEELQQQINGGNA